MAIAIAIAIRQGASGNGNDTSRSQKKFFHDVHLCDLLLSGSAGAIGLTQAFVTAPCFKPS
jgi:hypothetical protein